MRKTAGRRVRSVFASALPAASCEKRPRSQSSVQRRKAAANTRIDTTDRSRTRGAAVSSHQQLHQSGASSDAQQPRRIPRDRRCRGWRRTRSLIKTIRNSEAPGKIIPRALRPTRVPLTHPLETITPPHSGRNTSKRSNSSEARPTYSGGRRDTFEARGVFWE